MVNLTPELIAIPNSEHSHQSALFCWLRSNRGKQVYEEVIVGTSKLVTVEETTHLAKAFAIPNGDKRSASAASRLKAEGVSGGVPDIFLPTIRPAISAVRLMASAVPEHGFTLKPMYPPQRASYGGLWVEMKRPEVRGPTGKITHRHGTISEAQSARINELSDDGYLVSICYTWDEALNAMLKYLRL